MAYNSAYTGSQVDAAVGAVRQKETKWDNKQDELTGTEDQLVGFNSAGEATAVSKPTYTAADVGAMPAVSGGTTGQVLTKTEAGQEWQDAPDGLPAGGEEGQVLTKTSTGAQWDDVPSDIPTGGTQGQVLTKGDGETVTWSDPASGLPTGGTPGQMLYQGESGTEWGIPPYLGSMPQLDYSQMKSLHALGITDLNDVREPGTYVGLSGFGYPDIDNLPDSLINYVFWLDVYQFKGFPSIPAEQQGIVLVQEFHSFFPYYLPSELHGRDYKRIIIIWGDAASVPTEIGPWEPCITWADYVAFTPGATGLTADNVQDAIEEVNEKIPSAPKSVSITLPASGWSSNTQTVTVQGVKTSGQSVRISPATKTDADNWVAAGVWCSEPTTANRLVFTCDTAPTENININVELQEVQS